MAGVTCLLVFLLCGCASCSSLLDLAWQRADEEIYQKTEMPSGMVFTQMEAIRSDDGQILLVGWLDSRGEFEDYYAWYSNPQRMKEDYRFLCEQFVQADEKGKPGQPTNVFVRIEANAVYDYEADTLYLPSMYEQELTALLKFEVTDIRYLIFDENAQDYLIAEGFSSGINEDVDAPIMDVFWDECPEVFVHNGVLETNFENATVF